MTRRQSPCIVRCCGDSIFIHSGDASDLAGKRDHHSASATASVDGSPHCDNLGEGDRWRKNIPIHVPPCDGASALCHGAPCAEGGTVEQHDSGVVEEDEVVDGELTI